ncbi:MAG: class I SAM-dependent methyltransferase [Ginsengibacter sp.]
MKKIIILTLLKSGKKIATANSKMYSSFQLAKKYFYYFFHSYNGKGHGVHSPFVFDFIIHVLNDKKKYDCYSQIENLRKQLLADNNWIEVEDFGAGSAKFPFKKRKIKEIAASSLKKKKYAQLLFRIAQYYKAKTIVELGTSFGISTSYLASANPLSNVYTFEGASNIAAIAQQNFKKEGLANIELIQGDFANTLPVNEEKTGIIDLLFVDGNHRKNATIDYFKLFLKKSSKNSIFIFDDIHWSEEMEEAWEIIKAHPSVTLSIDLFFIGLIFFSEDFRVKQDFPIRF